MICDLINNTSGNVSLRPSDATSRHPSRVRQRSVYIYIYRRCGRVEEGMGAR